MSEKEINAELKKVQKILESTVDVVKQKKLPDDVGRSAALSLDKSIKIISQQQAKATEEGVNVNDKMMKCVKLAQKCWRRLGALDYSWSSTTKDYTKGWKIATGGEEDEDTPSKTATIKPGQHPEQQPGEKPYDTKPVDEAKYDQAEHWKLLVVERLKTAAKDMAKNQWEGKVRLNASAPPSAWSSVEEFHKAVFQLQDKNPQKFNEYLKASGKTSKLVTECIGKAIQVLKVEYKNLQAGQGSQLLLLVTEADEKDFASAKEHWNQAFVPLLVSLTNATLSKEPYVDIMVATGGKGAAQMLEKFFKPLRGEHQQIFKTANLDGPVPFKFKDMPPELQALLSKAKSQLEAALKAVLESKTNSTYFRYAPIEESPVTS